jgi:polyisoprenyl-phosphate glycosyltransferase
VPLIITMPVYDDWEAAALLCAAIDAELRQRPSLSSSIVIVDDGSNQPVGSAFDSFHPQAVKAMRILRLRRNLGHQRALAVSLAYIEQKMVCDAVIVMDADGDDRPEDILRLVEKFESSEYPKTVFAERGRRAESLSFKIFYLIYRVLHRIFTGRRIRFGNFSLLPADHLRRIVAYPELWNHYAAAVLASRLPYATVRADRGQRLRGRSRMNFVTFVVHGLSALFASYEVVSTRILVGAMSLMAALVALIGVVAGIKFFTKLAIPGWATLAVGLLFVLTLQLVAASLTIIFSVIVNRNALGFLPMRDYSWFVADYEEIKFQ